LHKQKEEAKIKLTDAEILERKEAKHQNYLKKKDESLDIIKALQFIDIGKSKMTVWHRPTMKHIA
jgi:hypothetical protein